MTITQTFTDFLDEVQSHCTRKGISPSYLTNRVLGQTYALPRMLAAAESIDDRIERLRKAMGQERTEPVFPEIPAPSTDARRSITLDLPTPPSTNALHRKGTTGDLEVHRTQAYNTWRRLAAQQIMVDRAGWVKKALPANMPYVARILIPVGDRADVDNRIKALLDLLVHMQITPDDKHLLRVSCQRSGKVEQRRCLITVRSVPVQVQG